MAFDGNWDHPGDAWDWLKDKFGGIGKIGDESSSSKQKRDNLNNQGGMSSVFADQGQQGFGQLGAESAAARQHLADQASGKVSLSGEQLRQALQQNVNAQRSMAAGASPGSAPMAARAAANNAASLGYGMAGQAATAGIQEREAAARALNDALAQQRQMELNAALGSRQNAISAYGGTTPEKSWLEKYGPAVTGAIGAAIK